MKIRDRFTRAEIESQMMLLTQMGAKITVLNSKTCYIKFDIDDIFVSYFYNVNKHDKYFLSRVLPYPVAIDEFETEEDIVELISDDIEKFQNAVKSHNIDEFIFINQLQLESVKMLEELFLYYNVDKEDLDKIMNSVKNLHEIIKDTASRSKRVYDKTEPHNLI